MLWRYCSRSPFSWLRRQQDEITGCQETTSQGLLLSPVAYVIYIGRGSGMPRTGHYIGIKLPDRAPLRSR